MAPVQGGRGQPNAGPAQRDCENQDRHEPGPGVLLAEQPVLQQQDRGKILRGKGPALRGDRLQARLGRVRQGADRVHEQVQPLQTPGQIPGRAPVARALGRVPQPKQHQQEAPR